MGTVKGSRDDIAVYIEDREYIANQYVMKCFFITMVFYVVSFILNQLEIFIVDKQVMTSGFFPSLIIYVIMLIGSKMVSLSNEKVKYFILFAVMVVYTIMGITITYHVVLASVLPFLYATLYSSKKLMRYVYVLTVISTICIVYGGFYWGLCDANMALLTTGRLQEHSLNGQFLLTTVNQNPIYSLFVFYVVPRCLIYFAFVFVCNNIIRIVSGSIEKAKLTAELERAKTEAETANQAKSKFLARMSHEIRTPINAIFGMNEMILRESKEPAIRKYASDAKDSSEILLSIINEILDSSKIESGMMELVPVNYKLGSLLNDVYNMMNVRAKEKKLELIFDIDPNMPKKYYGDDKRIRQILINLLNNGIKYTNKGKVTLKITCDVEGEMATLHCAVADTGIGIKPEDIGKLYEEFKRIDSGRNRNVEGTGLGMSIVQQFLKMMNSELQIVSEYEKGSVFSFDIEQKIVDKKPLGDFHKRYIQSVDTEFKTSFIAPEAKVLVVDDVEMNRTVFKALLKKTRMQILEAGGGKECLEMLKEQKVDIVFLDHMMPEMDGLETYNILKEMQDYPSKKAPVVIVTANAVIGAKDRYIVKEGFRAYLSKPLDYEKLEKVIKRLLKRTLVKEAEILVEENIEEEELPLVNGLDWGYAQNHFLNRKDMLQTVKFFYQSIDSDLKELQELYAKLETEDGYKNYCTKIHSMKNSAATVGIIPLAGTAKVMEDGARNGRRDIIDAFMPIFEEKWISYKELLKVVIPEKESTVKTTDNAELQQLIERIRKAAEDMDITALDELAEEMDGYETDAENGLKCKEIKEAIARFDVEYLLTI